MDPADQIIDVWMQHPTPSFIGHPMFESLRRWMGMDWPAAEIPNVYIDTSAYKAKRFPPELIAYMRAHGRRKVLFGTNYPMITPQMALEGLDGLGLDEEARRLFLCGNAQRIEQALPLAGRKRARRRRTRSRGPWRSLPCPAAVGRRHLSRCEEYKPSRRRSAPI